MYLFGCSSEFQLVLDWQLIMMVGLFESQYPLVHITSSNHFRMNKTPRSAAPVQLVVKSIQRPKGWEAIVGVKEPMT